MKFNLFAYFNEFDHFQVEKFSFNKGKNRPFFIMVNMFASPDKEYFIRSSFFREHFNKMADKINEESVHLHECEAVAQAIV